MDYKQQEQRLEVFKRDGWRCRSCGKRLSHPNAVPQLGHLINQSKMNIKKYGKEVIHHPMNMKSACSLFCNQKLSLYGKDKSIENLVEKIQKELDNDK